MHSVWRGFANILKTLLEWSSSVGFTLWKFGGCSHEPTPKRLLHLNCFVVLRCAMVNPFNLDGHLPGSEDPE